MSTADAMRRLTLQADSPQSASPPVRSNSSGLAPSPEGTTMAWRSATPEAEREQKRRLQREYRESLEAQIGEKHRQSAHQQSETTSPAAKDLLGARQVGSSESGPRSQPASTAPGDSGPGVSRPTPVAVAEPEELSSGAAASSARFEPQAPSRLPPGSPRRLHSVALLPPHEQAERHALREKQNAAAAALRTQMAENEQRAGTKRSSCGRRSAPWSALLPSGGPLRRL
jgi:hypothetical protein